MNRDPLIVAARSLALLWYVEHHDGAYTAEADDWAHEHYVAFLADATEVLGKALLGMDLSPEEQQQAEQDLARAEASYKQP
jgi:hypothetical protein